jgi:hypothetical protein
MIGSENENELALDNVAGIRERTQLGGGPKSGRRAEDGGKSETFGRADGGDPSGARDPRRTAGGNQDEGRGTEVRAEGGGWRKIGDLRSGGRRRPFGCPRPAPNSRRRRRLPHGGEGIPTRNGRILVSFGNSIVVCVDHSCRQGIARDESPSSFWLRRA